MNWKVRLKQKYFWLTLIPALIVLAQMVAGWFGAEIPAEVIEEEAVKFINTIFVLLTILGIAVDPTTEGVSDSWKALTYDKPKPKG